MLLDLYGVVGRPGDGRGRGRPFLLLAKMAFCFLFLGASTWTLADSISGTVQDPSGAVIASAQGSLINSENGFSQKRTADVPGAAVRDPLA